MSFSRVRKPYRRRGPSSGRAGNGARDYISGGSAVREPATRGFVFDFEGRPRQNALINTMNEWWMWIVLGFVLVVIELLTPGGLFIIFFGVGAIVVGLLTLLGIVERAWVAWLLFPIIALAALRVFRAPLLARLQKNTFSDSVDSLVGETAIAGGSMAPGEHGRVELRGSFWNGQNVGTQTIAAAGRCRVVAVDGLRLDVVAP